MSEPLKPLRHPQGDLFVCDITDVILKDDMPSMEHPFYSLSKKPDREPRRYEHNGNWIEFRPSFKGLPTIYDKDLIIYVVSQLVAGRQAGRPLAKTIEIDPYAFLVFTERGTGGRDYTALSDSIDRLHGTGFRTNILFEGTRTDKWMGIVDGAELERDERTGKLLSLRISLSDMVLDAVENSKVLTLHRNYFRLRKPLERRVYELARKHCGYQGTWRCRMSTLHNKSGSRGSLREFRRLIRNLIQHDHLPDYAIALEDDDMLIFTNRGTMNKDKAPSLHGGTPKPYVDHEDLVRGVETSGGYDKYHLENEWQTFCVSKGIVPKKPAAHFLDFCRKYRENHGNA